MLVIAKSAGIETVGQSLGGRADNENYMDMICGQASSKVNSIMWMTIIDRFYRFFPGIDPFEVPIT